MRKLSKVLVSMLAFAVMFGVLALQPNQEAAVASTKNMSLTGSATSTSSIKLTWDKVSGAKRYVIKSAPCGSTLSTLAKLKKKATSYTATGLSKGRSYKFVVYAQKKKNGSFKTIAQAAPVHVVTGGSSDYTYPKSVTVSKKKLTLKKGKSAKLSAKIVKADASKELLGDDHASGIRFASSNTKVATVSAKGKVKAVGVGTCKVFAIAVNGVRGACKVTVTPKKQGSIATSTYTLTYAYTGTVPKGAPAVPAKASYKKGASVKKAAVPTLEGYVFSGWKGEPAKMPGKNVKVTGSWSKKKVKITYYFPKPNSDYDYSKFPVPEEEAVDIAWQMIYGENSDIGSLNDLPLCVIDAVVAVLPDIIAEGKEDLAQEDEGSSAYYSIKNTIEDFEDLQKRLVPIQEELQQAEEEAYLTYTDSIELGESYTVKTAESIEAFTSVWGEDMPTGAVSWLPKNKAVRCYPDGFYKLDTSTAYFPGATITPKEDVKLYPGIAVVN